MYVMIYSRERERQDIKLLLVGWENYQMSRVFILDFAFVFAIHDAQEKKEKEKEKPVIFDLDAKQQCMSLNLYMCA